MAAADPNEVLAVLEPRALVQFTDPNYQGPKIFLSPKTFEQKVSSVFVYVCVHVYGSVEIGRREWRAHTLAHTRTH